MGPTVVVPGTQFRNAPTDRMSTYSNIRGQVPMTVKAGTVAFTHYDLWHGTASNSSSVKRHMIKFLFNRASENSAPSWNHDPEATEPAARTGMHATRRRMPSTFSLLATPWAFRRATITKSGQFAMQAWQELMGQRVRQIEAQRFEILLHFPGSTYGMRQPFRLRAGWNCWIPRVGLHRQAGSRGTLKI